MRRSQSTDRVVVVGEEPALSRRLSGSYSIFTSIKSEPDAIVEDCVRYRARLLLIGRSVKLPDALAICSAVREMSNLGQLPIMMLGTREGGQEEMEAFRMGVDDFIGRSISSSSLALRMNALLRRYAQPTDQEFNSSEHAIEIGDMRIEPESYSVRVSGRIVNLTAGEFRLLWKLARNKGRILTGAQLATSGLGPDVVPTERSVRSRIFSLRQKLGASAFHIQTIRNAGYKLSE